MNGFIVAYITVSRHLYVTDVILDHTGLTFHCFYDLASVPTPLFLQIKIIASVELDISKILIAKSMKR